MQVNRYLPKTNKPLLLAVILALVAASLFQAAMWLRNAVIDHSWFDFAGGVFWLALSIGLWFLHPVARQVSVVVLWLMVIVVPLGTVNPFNAGDRMAAGETPPTIGELAVWLVPLIVLVLVALHMLGKYKAEFRR